MLNKCGSQSEGGIWLLQRLMELSAELDVYFLGRNGRNHRLWSNQLPWGWVIFPNLQHHICAGSRALWDLLAAQEQSGQNNFKKRQQFCHHQMSVLSVVDKGWNPCRSWSGSHTRNGMVKHYGRGRREYAWLSFERLACATSSIQVSFILASTWKLSTWKSWKQ